jgi:hypothetical protein
MHNNIVSGNRNGTCFLLEFLLFLGGLLMTCSRRGGSAEPASGRRGSTGWRLGGGSMADGGPGIKKKDKNINLRWKI